MWSDVFYSFLNDAFEVDRTLDFFEDDVALGWIALRGLVVPLPPLGYHSCLGLTVVVQ